MYGERNASFTGQGKRENCPKGKKRRKKKRSSCVCLQYEMWLARQTNVFWDDGCFQYLPAMVTLEILRKSEVDTSIKVK